MKAKQHIEQLEATNTRLNAAIAAVNDAKKNLAIARENHDFYVERRNETKNLLADVRALHAKNCDKERHAGNGAGDRPAGQEGGRPVNGRNKRWAEQRWDKRQPDRLAHIRKKKEDKSHEKAKKPLPEAGPPHRGRRV